MRPACRVLLLSASFAFCLIAPIGMAGCGGSSSSGGGGTVNPPVTTTLSVSASSLSFTGSVGSAAPAAQTVTLTSTGTAAVTFTSIALTGTGAGSFTLTNNCGTTLSASCTLVVGFTPAAGSGTATASLAIADTASGSPQNVALTGVTTSTPTASNTVDCSTTTGTGAASTGGPCTALTLQGDPISPGGFHGYADPSLRKDPNSTVAYLAYSWPRTLADGTHVVDLHLASSTNNGTTFTAIGPLYQTFQVTQTTSPAYNSLNDTSTETVDLLPIPLTGASAGQTLWVQAHQSYLVKPQAGIYDQLNATGIISVSAVQLAAPAAANAGMLLQTGFATAGEARLGTNVTDSTRLVTQNVAALTPNASKCGNWGQAALWFQAPTLYLALECSQVTGNGNVDANELAHFLYATTPTGTDASKWTWSFVSEFATMAQAAKLGTQEGTAYQFFTEPEFVQGRSGQLYFIMTPSVFAPQAAQQPVIQYGCRTMPVTSLSPAGITLATDATTGVLAYTTKVTENDLYTGANEGPAACTYDPGTNLGIVIGRKYENDPLLGFDIFPVGTALNPQ